jgi:hypothetical protein
MPTIEQRFIGTPLFASPEQLLVQPLDARSDFFALGMTLWFLVLGAPPEPGNSAAIVASRLKAESYAERLPRKLPQAFQAVLARLLEKQPENRFASAAQLVAAFGKCAAGLGLPTAPTSAYALGAEAPEEETGPPQPAALERIEVPVEECYTLQGERGGNATGADYEALALADQSTVWLHFLQPAIVAHTRTMEHLRRHLGRLQRRPAPALLGVTALREHPDRTLVLMEAPAGPDLLAASKSAGPMRLAEARPILQSIASACDTLLAAGLPAPELEPHRVFIRPSATAAPGSAQLIPQFLTRSEIAALEGVAPTAEEPGWHFAVLVHRLLAARNLPAKPVLTAEDCGTVPGLSEEANRLLAQALARQLMHATCSELLADLLIAEGLMGSSVTRTHASLTATASPATTHGTATPPRLPVTPLEDSQLTAALPPARPPSIPAVAAPPPLETHAPSAWPIIIGAAVLLLALLGGGAWLVLKQRSGEGATFLGANVIVRLQGDLPAHSVARLGAQELPIEKDADGWRVSFDGRKIPFPARLEIAAKGFAPLPIPLMSPADLQAAHDARLQRAEGTLVFNHPENADYDHAVLRMTAQLPDEQSYVDLEPFNRGASFASQPELNLPTGIYQLTIRGADERIVRPRVFDRITIKPDERTAFDLPPSFAAHFAGTMTAQRESRADGEPAAIEVIIDPGLASGTFLEPGPRGPRRIPMIDGRLDSDGTYTARVQCSLVTEGEPGFDRILSLRRGEDGGFDCEVSESPDENPPLERRLHRQPFPKNAFSAKGTLRAAK